MANTHFLGKISARSVRVDGTFRCVFKVRFVGIRAKELTEAGGIAAKGWLAEQITVRLDADVPGHLQLRVIGVDEFRRALCVPLLRFDAMPEEFVGGRAVPMPPFFGKLNYVHDGDTATFSVMCRSETFASMEQWEVRRWFRSAQPHIVVGGWLVL